MGSIRRVRQEGLLVNSVNLLCGLRNGRGGIAVIPRHRAGLSDAVAS